MSLFKKMLGVVILTSGVTFAQIPVIPPGGSGSGGCNSGTTTNLLVGDGSGGCTSSGIASANVGKTNTTNTWSTDQTFLGQTFIGTSLRVGNPTGGFIRFNGTAVFPTTDVGMVGFTYNSQTSGNVTLFGVGSATFQPTTGSANFAGFAISPTINGTSTGTAYGAVIAPITNVLTGGTVKLQGWGTATGNNWAGYSEKSFVALDGTYNGPVNATVLRSPNTYVGRSQTGALTQTIVASAVGATYRITLASNCDAAAGSTAYTASVSYTDTSSTVQTIASGAIDCTTLGANSKYNTVQVGNVKSGTAISLATTTSGAVTYDVSVVAEQITTN